MAPFRITFVVETVIDFVYYNIVGCIILLPVSIYLFKIFNSLYVKIRDENLSGNSATQGSGNHITIAVESGIKNESGQRY